MTGLTALVNTDHLFPSNSHEGQLVVGEAATATACLEHGDGERLLGYHEEWASKSL